MATRTPLHPRSTASPGLLGRAAAGTAIAVVAVAAAYVVADGAGDALLVAPELGGSEPERLSLGVAVGATIVGGLIGAVLAIAARRVGRRARATTTFVALCLIALVGYGFLAFVRSEHASTALWLNLMHLVAAVPIVGALAGWLRSSRT